MDLPLILTSKESNYRRLDEDKRYQRKVRNDSRDVRHNQQGEIEGFEALRSDGVGVGQYDGQNMEHQFAGRCMLIWVS